MAGEEPQETSESWSIKRAGDFLKNILDLEANVSQLQKENAQLRDEVGRLQRLVDEHSGQLRVRVGALNSTLENRVTLAAQKAAIDTAVRLLGDQSEKPTDDAPDQ